ncbi:transglycosylase SLT domain-containing protein [Streptacidiphilus sp. N1-3]|uniref:Transglycosylase SLT domain-containing protein n=1 Tax=Streptacidiphilus alkalitolerans TaxID=3342712 RepID=A0ABV6WT79_9ACTN
MGSTTLRRTAAGLLSVAVSAALLTGCAQRQHSTTVSADAPGTAGASVAADPSGAAGSAGASASATASATPSATPSARKSVHPSASRSQAAPAKSAAAKLAAAKPPPKKKAGPVAPKPPAVATGTPPLQSSCKPSYTGTNASRSDVGAALANAAGQSRTLSLSLGGTDQLPPLPVNLVRAIAWQESGWQSAILACDGGIGTMQIMPATATWMNGKFGTGADVHTLAGNTELGAELLDELVAYYGDSDFGGDYNLAPDPVTGDNPLLDLVIAAYNAGAGNVHYTTTTDPATGTTIGKTVIPNPGYVSTVKALMADCPCLNG